MEIIDRLSAGDPEKRCYYINLFLEVLEPELKRMQADDILTGANQELLRQILHKLKSQVQTIGEHETHQSMNALELKISKGQRAEAYDLSPIIEQLTVLIRNLQQQLE
ncbi:MAG: hypothetical protein P8M07_00350 [Flavobacteriales bacterium]|nr:hypothetical protein [Flavobacteriales bacterium]